MKIKRKLGYFFTAAIITALIIVSAAAFVIAEKNTLNTGIRKIKCGCAVTINEDTAVVVINDNEYSFPDFSEIVVRKAEKILPFVGILFFL